MNPDVKTVKANPDFTLELMFENGVKKIFDMKPYLSIGVFRQLKDYKRFKKVKPFMGSIAWATGQDLCYDTLYVEGKKISRSSYKVFRKESSLVAAEPKAPYLPTGRQARKKK